MAPIDWAQVVDYVAVALFGALVGAGELVARYRDAPERAVQTGPALLYVGVNMAAAAAALLSIRVFGWTFGNADANQARLVQVFVAGFASMALFRSSLFNVRVGDADVPVGPSSFLKVLLDAADRGVDRERAKSRVSEVRNAMEGVSFAKARAGLPTLCFELMQNVPEQDQAVVGQELDELAAAAMDDDIKVVVLGLKLMNVVGADVLLRAADSLAPKIRKAASIELEPMHKLQLGEAVLLQARVLDVKGGKVDTLVAWSSDDPAIAAILASGLVTGASAGKTLVSATAEGLTAHATIEVLAPMPITSLSPATATP